MIFEFIALFSIISFLSYSVFVLDVISTEILPIIGTFCVAAYRIMPAANRILVSLQRIKFSTNSLENLYLAIENEKIDDDNKHKAIYLSLSSFNKLNLSI